MSAASYALILKTSLNDTFWIVPKENVFTNFEYSLLESFSRSRISKVLPALAFKVFSSILILALFKSASRLFLNVSF